MMWKQKRVRRKNSKCRSRGRNTEPEHQSGKDQLEESQVEETVALPEQSESDETEDEGMPGEAAGKETEETGEAASERKTLSRRRQKWNRRRRKPWKMRIQ